MRDYCLRLGLRIGSCRKKWRGETAPLGDAAIEPLPLKLGRQVCLACGSLIGLRVAGWPKAGDRCSSVGKNVPQRFNSSQTFNSSRGRLFLGLSLVFKLRVPLIVDCYDLSVWTVDNTVLLEVPFPTGDEFLDRLVDLTATAP